MKVEIKIPAMGESVAEATVSKILKPSGSYVKLDEEILELETDKVNQVLHAPQSGQLTLTVNREDTVKIGQVIGFVETDAKAHRRRSSPGRLQLQSQLRQHLPLHQTGESARVMMPDFAASLKEAAQNTAAPRPLQTQPAVPTTGEKVDAQKNELAAQSDRLTASSKRKTPPRCSPHSMRSTCPPSWRSGLRKKTISSKNTASKLGFMSFFVKGVVAALKANPQVNASIDGDEIMTFHTYDIGVAVSTERGFMVPVVKNCDQLNFGGVEKAIESFSQKKRAKERSPSMTCAEAVLRSPTAGSSAPFSRRRSSTRPKAPS